jgi:hypothetical protein
MDDFTVPVARLLRPCVRFTRAVAKSFAVLGQALPGLQLPVLQFRADCGS